MWAQEKFAKPMGVLADQKIYCGGNLD